MKMLVPAIIGAVCFVSAGLFPSTAVAQYSQYQLHDLLRSTRNVAEIELTDRQKQQIEDLRQQIRERRSLTTRAMQEYEKEAHQRMLDVLNSKQRERLSQLFYQGLGPRALQESATAAELKLSDDQKQQIQQIRKDAEAAWRKDRRNYNRIIAERNEKYLTVLTRQQRSRWDKMLGAPRKRELSLSSSQQRKLWSDLRRLAPLSESRYAAELEITDKQREQIRSMTRQLWSENTEVKQIQQEHGEKYAKAKTDAERTRIREEMGEAVGKIYQAGIEKIEAVLNSRQRERLAKIQQDLSQSRYRSIGTAGIATSDDIAEKLRLTTDQRKALDLMHQAAIDAERNEQRESQQRIQKIKEQRDEDYLKLLSPEQRNKWEKMIGRPIKRPKPNV